MLLRKVTLNLELKSTYIDLKLIKVRNKNARYWKCIMIIIWKYEIISQFGP